MNIPPLQPDAAQAAANAPKPKPKPNGPACMNCGAALQAKFCHVCGQRKQRLVVSLFAIFVELIEGVFDIESKLWRTLWPLFARPGFLTKSFMEGKRERYLPPVRLYLISSILFFLLISLSPQNFISKIADTVESYRGDESSMFVRGLDTPLNTATFREIGGIATKLSNDSGSDLFVIDFDNEENESEDTVVPAGESLDQDGVETLDTRDLATIESRLENSANQNETSQTEPNQATAGKETATQDTQTASQENETTQDSDDDEIEIMVDCEGLNDADYAESAEFLRKPAVRMCKSISTVRGMIDFIGELIDSLPKTLLVLIPLMAFANKLLYLFAGRYYVEHLLYYVHNYSFLFLFTVVLTGISKLAGLVGLGNAVSNVLFPAGMLYTVYYFFKSMRVVYGQGFIFTFTKWITLMLSFFILVSVVIVFFTLATAAVHAI